MWSVAGTLDFPRLGVAGALAVATMVVWLIVRHHMWERPGDHPARVLAVLYNATTATTVTVGVLAMYAGVFALGLLTQALFVDGGLLARTLGHPS
jgi:hypothetical protein